MLYIIRHRSHVASGYLAIDADNEMSAMARAGVILSDTDKYGWLLLRDLECFPVQEDLREHALRVVERVNKQLTKHGTSTSQAD